MERSTLINLLQLHHFRPKLSVEGVIVVHGIAGTGKTTLLRTLFSAYPNLVIGSPRPCYLDKANNISQVCLSCFPNTLCDIVDEYHLLESYQEPTLALFGDPCQCTFIERLRIPHYTSFRTHRFGKSTAELLNKLFQLQIVSVKQEDDIVEFFDPFQVDPTENISASEEEVLEFVSDQVVTTSSEELAGLEFTETTFYCTTLAAAVTKNPARTFISLTRHTQKLTIGELNARIDS
uniref:TGBp1 n=1 Tax=Pepino mosaic virus TaxID=112229 RepID=Q1L7W9_9VIRU|nr:TGBp1 [Pepino mosaic virus]